MNEKANRKSPPLRLAFLLLMLVFGCLGPVVRQIGLPSPVIAWFRAVVSAVVLTAYILISGIRAGREYFRKYLGPLLASGFFLAVDWIGLFESYNHTTVATATVCYYITPMLVLLLSAIVLKERLAPKHIICAITAFVGMVLVSGTSEGGPEAGNPTLGIIYAVIGAVGYALVIIINKRFPGGDPILRTDIQLASAALFVTPYAFLRYDFSSLSFSARSVFFLLLLCVVFTALAYIFYYSLIQKLPSRTVAIFSYADPVVACLLSVFFLGEHMSLAAAAGAVLIIGSAVFSET